MPSLEAFCTCRRIKQFRPVLSLCVVAALAACQRPEVEREVESVQASALPPLDTLAMRDSVERLAKELLVPGAVVILQTPKGNFELRYGVTSYRGSTPVDFDQHVRVGSNTKTWTGTVILQLVQEGKLKLEDPVSKYRPEVPNGAHITIEQLLSMRSGLYNYSQSRELNQALDEQPKNMWTPQQLLALAFAQPPAFAPGTQFGYSNTNTVLLGLIAEQIDGKPLGEIMRDRLFLPTGLKNTLFPSIANTNLPEPFTRGYMYGNNVMTIDEPALPESMRSAARSGELAPVDWTDASASWTWAAGMGISTARELVKWVQALVGGQLLNSELQAQRLASVKAVAPQDPGSASYGWAIARFGNLYGHTGEMPGYNSFMGHDPINNVTLVVWTNLAPAVDGRDPASTIARTVIDMVYGEE